MAMVPKDNLQDLFLGPQKNLFENERMSPQKGTILDF